MFLRGLLVDLEPQSREFQLEKNHEYTNNPSAQWARVGDNTLSSRAQIERRIEGWRGGRERGYLGVHFQMRARDGNLIGSIGLNWVDAWHRIGVLGAWIGEANYWGGGHGTDALLLVCEYAFDWLDLRRLTLGTMAPNERAQRNVEKCGFVLEARERKATFCAGEWVDLLEYGMMRDEWRGRAALVAELGLVERARQRYGDLVPALENGR